MAENLTTYDINDPGSNLTVTATQVVIDVMDEDTNVSDDKGAAHFGDFTHDWEFEQATDGTALRLTGLWAVANVRDDLDYWQANNSEALYVDVRDTTNDSRVRIVDAFAGTNDGSFSAPEVRYYCTTQRTGTALEMRMYTDSGRTVLYDALTLVIGAASYQYVYACNSKDGNAGWKGWFANLDLNEAVSFVPFPRPRGLASGMLSVNGGMS